MQIFSPACSQHDKLMPRFISKEGLLQRRCSEKRTLKHYDYYGQAWQKLYRGQMDDWIFISKSNEQQERK